MFNSQLPPLSELPTSRQLVRSTLIAAGVAGALLTTVVLPSEYGVDPTGVGRVLGLTEMGKIKVQLASENEQNIAADGAADLADKPTEVAAQAAQPITDTVPQGERSDTTTVTLEPGEASEIKLAASKGAKINFDWSVAGGHVNYDTHADAPGIEYHGYGKGKESQGERGTLNAAFDGKHGWYWRNRSGATVVITLRTSGAYSAIKRVV